MALPRNRPIRFSSTAPVLKTLFRNIHLTYLDKKPARTLHWLWIHFLWNGKILSTLMNTLRNSHILVSLDEQIYRVPSQYMMPKLFMCSLTFQQQIRLLRWTDCVLEMTRMRTRHDVMRCVFAISRSQQFLDRIIWRHRNQYLLYFWYTKFNFNATKICEQRSFFSQIIRR